MISRAYTRMGVAAINVSSADLTLGLSFFRTEASQGLPLISANLMDPTRKSLIFSPYTIKRVGNVRIALFGLTSPVQKQAVIHSPENKFNHPSFRPRCKKGAGGHQGSTGNSFCFWGARRKIYSYTPLGRTHAHSRILQKWYVRRHAAPHFCKSLLAFRI